jgi:hypothetical protein
MSLIQDIVKFGLGQFGIQATGDTPKAIATSALTSFLTQKVNKAIKKTNLPSANQASVTTSSAVATNTTQKTIETIERKVKVEIAADTDAGIPVVYGEGYVQPLLVDAVLTNSQCTMWYAVALCEATGVDLAGAASLITFEEIYWEGKKITFYSDGNRVAASWEGKGASAKQDLTLTGNVEIYCYNNGSSSPCNVRPQGLAVNHGNAYNIMPGWGVNHQMSGLAFALIKVNYDAEKEVKGLGSLRFKMRNSMSKPGDVLNDYMTSTVYGAGISAGEID